MSADPRSERVSLEGLDPETALRALLAIKPDQVDDDEDRHDGRDDEAPDE